MAARKYFLQDKVFSSIAEQKRQKRLRRRRVHTDWDSLLEVVGDTLLVSAFEASKGLGPWQFHACGILVETRG